MTTGTMESTRDLLRGLEVRERDRGGGSLNAARLRIARRIGVVPGTLYNIAFNRVKRIDEAIRFRLSEYAIADLEREIERLNHELELAKALGRAQDQRLVQRLEAVRDRAAACLAEA